MSTKAELEERVFYLESALQEIVRTTVNCKSGRYMVTVAERALTHVDTRNQKTGTEENSGESQQTEVEFSE